MLHSIMRLAATSLGALDMPKPEASQLLQAVEGLIDSVKMGVGVASKSVLATGLRCVCVCSKYVSKALSLALPHASCFSLPLLSL